MPKSPADKQPNFRHTLETIARTNSSPVSVFADFVKISACAVAYPSREDEYLETVERYTKDEVNDLCSAFASLVNEMQQNPFHDVLGSYYETINSKSARDGRGEFFTPEPISELLAMISFDVEKIITDTKPVTVSEPACGSGGMILQMAKRLSPERTGREKSYVDLLRVTAQDLSPVACDMTYVNTTLWGIPAQILRGNTLTGKFDKGWNNLHWLRVGEDERQRLLHTKRQIEDVLLAEPEIPEKPSQPAYDFTVSEQMDFNL